MIIFFDVTAAELREGFSDQVEAVVSELVGAFRRGDHVVVMRRETVEELRTHPWSPSVQATLERLARDFTQSADLLNKSSCVLCVRLTVNIPRPIQRNFNVITLAEILLERLYLPGVLLVENATRDGSLFQILLDDIGKQAGIARIYVEAVHGGGDDIAGNLEHQINLGKYTVCIIDSDKMSPFCVSPPKERQLRRVCQTSGWRFVKVVMLECHEIENLLHPDLILGLRCARQYKDRNLLKKIQRVEPEIFGDNSLWRYFDIKNGINADVLARYEGKSKEWISMKLIALGLDEMTFSIAGFGDRVIDSLLDDVNKYRLIRQMVTRNKEWMHAFSKLFEDIVWYFAGLNPTYT